MNKKVQTSKNFFLDFPKQKNALQEKEGIPVQQIRLIYSGKILKDEISIEEAKIAPGSTLMMMMHLKGGF